jgi:hypothetical protein
MNPDQRLRFLALLDALMTDIGAALVVAHERIYVFPTRYGVLRIQPAAGDAPSICSRFLTPERVGEVAGVFNADDGTWDHNCWTDWIADFEPGFKLFARRLSAIALSHADLSPTEKPFRRPDGSVVRFCQNQLVEITTTAGELWKQSTKYFQEGARPRLRVVPPHDFGALHENAAHSYGSE